MGQLDVVAGHPQLASLGSPEMWSPKVLVKFYAAAVVAAISNTDYEGEINSMGCKVVIRTTPDIDVKPYKKGMQLVHQRPKPGKEELDIDQGDYWDFIIDDVDRFQGDINYMEDWTKDASQQQKIYVDTNVLTAIPSQAHASNKGANAGVVSEGFNMGTTSAPVALSASNILTTIVDSGSVLDEQNVPEDNRVIVIPAWAAGLIKKSDIKDASLSGDGTSIMRNGRLGMIDRYTIYSSNLLSYSGTGSNRYWNAIACHKSALSFASQFIENQVLDQVESTFGKICRGLQVFGYKVLKPESLVQLIIKKA